MKTISLDLFSQLKIAVREARTRQVRPVAAFDADGTLWNTDLGEALFDYQIRNNLLPQLPKDPWAHYQSLKVEQSHEVAYLWLAQINSGLPLAQVRTWAKAAVDELAPVPLFREVKELISLLLELEVEVYIVTASIKWAVEPGAHLVGLKPEQVIGIETRVENGIITEHQHGPITYRRGKVDGLLARTDGQTPFFAAGNTEGDLPLLESANEIRLVVAGSPHGDRNFETEQRMLTIAAQRRWFAFNFL